MFCWDFGRWLRLSGAAVKGYTVWTFEAGARLATSTQVRFDETKYRKLMGFTS